MNELALFAGAGGGILGGKQLGWRTVCAVEYEPYAAGVLVARQNDGLLPPFPIWDDVRTFDGRPWRGRVGVVSGGFPCQDISVAGKGAGITGKRSGLWMEMARIIDEVRPRYAFVENSPMLTSRGLGVVLGDLAAMGFDARWGVLGAADVGAPHKRDRIWIVADDQNQRRGTWRQRRPHTSGARQQEQTLYNPDCDGESIGAIDDETSWVCEHASYANGQGLEIGKSKQADHGKKLASSLRDDWWFVEPDVGRVVNGVAARMDRLKAIGNGQVPLCAAEAWKILTA